MKSKFFLLPSCVLLVLVGVGLFYLGPLKENSPSEENTSISEEEESIDVEITIDDIVEAKLKEMSLKEKIGQMLIIYYSSLDYTTTLDNAIKNYHPGGFILMKDNISTTTQLRNFVSQMQANSKIPMFISIDQEGGKVQRLEVLTDIKASYIPAMKTVGEKNDEILAEKLGNLMAKELKVFGVNMNFAPVLDINNNPKNIVIGSRSFGNNAEVVSNMGLAVARGLENRNVIAVYKHFPGHGDTDVDSHYDLPVLTKTKKQLYQLELKPFIDAINNGAKVIMIGHLAVPEITGDNTPASLSKEIITDLLKNELHFEGVVVTDALNMGALTKNYSQDEILVKAIQAGVDLLLMPGSSSKTVETISKAIDNGDITEERINESVRKILKLKYENGLFESTDMLDTTILNNKDHQEIIKKFAK